MAFKKGQQNTDGQPRAKLIRDAINCLLSRPADDELNDVPKTVAQKIALKMVREAANGENFLKAFEHVRDTAEGKPTQTLAGDSENPLLRAVTVKIIGNGKND